VEGAGVCGEELRHMMEPTNPDEVRELLRRMDEVTAKADPVLLGGNDAVQPSLENAEASLSGLNANLRTLAKRPDWRTASRATPRRPPTS
jgi:hypothetical protein